MPRHFNCVKNGPERSSIAQETNWQLVEKRLREEKRRTLPLTDTSEAIKRFQLSSRVVQETMPRSRKTGLVEQQACFALLRKLKS